MSLSRGSSRSMFFRLWVRAPRIEIVSKVYHPVDSKARQYTCSAPIPAKKRTKTGPRARSARSDGAGAAVLQCCPFALPGVTMYQPDSMSSEERRAAASLASVVAFRMLGLFMVPPVLATYGQDLPGATTLLIGMAI